MSKQPVQGFCKGVGLARIISWCNKSADGIHPSQFLHRENERRFVV